MKRPEKEDYGFYVGKTFYFDLEDGEKKYHKALEKYADWLEGEYIKTPLLPKISELQKQIAELKSNNEMLLDLNKQQRINIEDDHEQITELKENVNFLRREIVKHKNF